MTAIAWAIFIYTVCYDKSLETAPQNSKNIASGLCTAALAFMVILTIRDIMR